MQTQADYVNVLTHMQPDTLTKSSLEESETRLFNGLGVYGRSSLQRLAKHFSITDKKVVYRADNSTIKDQAVKPSFRVNQ